MAVRGTGRSKDAGEESLQERGRERAGNHRSGDGGGGPAGEGLRVVPADEFLGRYRDDQVAALPAAAIGVAPGRAGSEWRVEKELPGEGAAAAASRATLAS